MPPDGVVRCALCGDVVSIVSTHTYRKVSGWVQRRQGGGTNAIRCREELHEYAHPGCVSERAATGGVAKGEQGALW